MKVHLTSRPDASSLAVLQEGLLPEVELSDGPEPVPGTAVLVNGRPSREQLDGLPELRALVIPFAGLPAVTADLLRDYPQLPVYNLHHNAIPTAEMALALLMAATRSLIPADREFRRHDWTPRYAPYPSQLIYGKRALILGYGAIGQHLGRMLRGMGVTVSGIVRSRIDPERGIYGPKSLRALLPKTDILCITVPGTPETEGMIGAEELALLPEGALLVNVGRGAVVDQFALYEALHNRHLAGAGLDVWYRYPETPEDRKNTPPADAPFHELDNVVLSPHRAGGGGAEEVEVLRMQALAQVLNQLARGETPAHRLDLDAGY